MVTISRLYQDYDAGAHVVAELERSGIPHDDISIIANNENGWFDRDGSKRIDRDADGTDDRTKGAATGAGIGATLGGVTGLLAGLGMLAIPGIGPVVAAGWLASTAAMAAAGGATGGLIGALTQSGIGEDEAGTYAEGVRRGGSLVTARVPDTDRARFEAIMDRYGTSDPTAVGAAHRTADRPGDRSASGMPGEAFQERTIDLTTHREEPVISKESQQEIVVRKDADQRTETLRGTVRETEVELEDDRAKVTAPAAPSTAPPRR
jgi:hypothetical protein